MPKLSRINLHPFKSLDSQAVDEAVILPSGALQHDRRFVLTDERGDFINAKRTAAIQLLRSHFDPVTEHLTLRVEGTDARHDFSLAGDRRELCDWLSNYFGLTVTILENIDGGYPDDTESPGPTLISTATLAAVASWYPGMTVDEVRLRFRANLEIDADEPFWEDRLVSGGLQPIRFQLGEVELLGTNPCQRCIVPTRHPQSATPTREFAKIFARGRSEALPDWAPRGRFDHFYRLAVNTQPGSGRSCTLRVGDELRLLPD
jgi:uncharacterized protein